MCDLRTILGRQLHALACTRPCGGYGGHPGRRDGAGAQKSARARALLAQTRVCARVEQRLHSYRLALETGVHQRRLPAWPTPVEAARVLRERGPNAIRAVLLRRGEDVLRSCRACAGQHAQNRAGHCRSLRPIDVPTTWCRCRRAPSKFGNRMKPWSRLKAPAPAERAEEAWLTDRRGAARPTRARQRGAAAAGPSPHEVRRDASAALAAGSDNAGLEKLGDILQRTPLAVTKGVVGAVKGVGPAIEGAEAALGRILRPRSDGPPPQTPPAPSSPPSPPSAPPSPPPDPSPPPAPPTSPTPASPPSPPLLPPPPPPPPPNHPPGAANWVVSPLPATSALCGSPAGVVPTAYRAQATSFRCPVRCAAALPRRLPPPPAPRTAHRCSCF